MVYYYELISHQNTSDNEEIVAKIVSTTEEKKRIVSVILHDDINSGFLNMYIEREKIATIHLGHIDYTGLQEIEVNADLVEGEEFRITLKNEVSGVNAGVYGLIKYEIK